MWKFLKIHSAILGQIYYFLFAQWGRFIFNVKNNHPWLLLYWRMLTRVEEEVIQVSPDQEDETLQAGGAALSWAILRTTTVANLTSGLTSASLTSEVSLSLWSARAACDLVSWLLTFLRLTNNRPSEAGLEVTGPSDRPSVASNNEAVTTNLYIEMILIRKSLLNDYIYLVERGLELADSTKVLANEVALEMICRT